MSNPTPPPNASPDFLTGWNARAAADGTAPTPAPAAPAAPIPLAPLVAKAKPGVLDLPKAVYQLTDSCIVAAAQAGLTIKGNGSTLICPAQHAAFILQGAHVIVDGFAVDACAIFASPQADRCTVSNCQIGLAKPGAVAQAVKTGPGGTNFTLLNSHVGVTSTVSFYADRDGPTISGSQLDGSLGEYVVRGETPDGVIIPTGFTILNSTIGLLQEADNVELKDAMGFRMFHGVHVSGSTIYRDVRFAQGNQPATTAVGQFCDALVEHCKFTGAHPGLPYLNIYQGASVVVLNCIFVDPAAASIVCAGQSRCTTGGNTNQISRGGKSYPVFASQGGAHVDQGGDQVIVAAA